MIHNKYIFRTKLLTVAGGPSNLGTAVAQSMNLTNSSEPMGSDNGAAYKSEPSDMMYYPNTTTDTMNQTTDSIFSALLDEQLGWNNEDLAFNVGDGKFYNLNELNEWTTHWI